MELLASLSNALRQLEQVQTSLDAGSLDEAVSAVLNVESYLTNGFEPWKRESQHYTELKVRSYTHVVTRLMQPATQERCEHLKAIVREQLETAYNACISFHTGSGLTVHTVYS